MALEAGADCIEHPLPRTDKSIRLMKKNNVFAVPTLVPYQLINQDGGYNVLDVVLLVNIILE